MGITDCIFSREARGNQGSTALICIGIYVSVILVTRNDIVVNKSIF
jgi:hypothetical protein